MRLFIALDLPDEITRFIQDLTDLLPEVEMVKAGHFHMTLQFLGEVTADRAERIQTVLREISEKAFELQMGELGVFRNPKGFARVVWLGMDHNPVLYDLQKEVEGRMKLPGFVPDKPFKPHLTLARVKFVPDNEAFEEEIKDIDFVKRRFWVRSFSLIESRLEPGGAKYRNVEIYSLNA